MTDIQTSVERDLSVIAGNLDAEFPGCAPITLIVVGQEGFIDRRVVANLMADYAGHVTFTGPVFDKAEALLLMMGYHIEWHRGAKMIHTLCGAARMLSAHERMTGHQGGGLQ